MRISDWSSDVCSSDLVALHGIATVFAIALPGFLPRLAGVLPCFLAICSGAALQRVLTVGANVLARILPRGASILAACLTFRAVFRCRLMSLVALCFTGILPIRTIVVARRLLSRCILFFCFHCLAHAT